MESSRGFFSRPLSKNIPVWEISSKDASRQYESRKEFRVFSVFFRAFSVILFTS